VYLPCIGSRAASEEHAELAGGAAGRGGVVLLAEDRADVRRFTARVLRECGYEVLEAESGEAALALARDHAGPVHVLLSDAVMPGMSGKILAERLRATPPEMRVVFMSGYTDDAVLARNVVEAGITFLQKPFTPVRLAAAVRSVLDEGLAARNSSAAG
jgi:two-component system cell cycle sensor histidine kinase/response regulator CckA